MTQEREQIPAPPPGFRKAIPVLAKLLAVLHQNARCKDCGEYLGDLKGIQFDHDPAIQLRHWDERARDTIPACSDPDFIVARHVDCHARKTSGRKGESDKNRANGDVAQIAKLRRLTQSQIEFRQRMLAKCDPEAIEEESGAKPRSRWPKRSFDRRRDGPPATRPQEDHARTGRQSLH